MSERDFFTAPSGEAFSKLCSMVTKIQDRLSALEAKQEPEPSQPSGSLVERVAEAFLKALHKSDNFKPNDDGVRASTAAIEAVADWLDDESVRFYKDGRGTDGDKLRAAETILRAEIKGE